MKKRPKTQGQTWNETRKIKFEKKKDLWKEEFTLFVILVFEFVVSLQKNTIAWSSEKNPI
jgi:hypothetical protein